MRLLIIFFLTVCLSGCGTIPRRPVPPEFFPETRVFGFSDIRVYGGSFSPLIQKSLVESIRQARNFTPNSWADDTGTINMLALSGGGPNGAFGAGILCGWTETGKRPVFKLVTGISTGALIAPFAFAGPQYDETLKKFYTTVSTKDIMKRKGFLSLLFGSSSFADDSPLARLIEECVTEDLFEEVAKAHEQGRRLLIGTTDLDSGRFIVWNMGEIAASGKPEALQLFRKVLLASASIPVMFPPQRFDVEARGNMYDELHVDGGTVTSVFFYGSLLNLKQAFLDADVKTPLQLRLYVIINEKIKPDWKKIKPAVMPIAHRAVSELLSCQVIDDIYRIYMITQKDNIDFNYTYIPSDFKSQSSEHFDPVEMRKLFDFGFAKASQGYRWEKAPPEFEAD